MSTYIWFCRECKRKGDMDGKELANLMFAQTVHKACSPSCENLIRIATVAETNNDPELQEYKSWDED